jgi:hypothetical protein
VSIEWGEDMGCLTDADVQAVADDEATELARTHAAGCDRCRDRVNDRRQLVAQLVSLEANDDLRPGFEGRLRAAVDSGRAVRGATVLRDSPAGSWRRAGLVSAVATAAVIAVVVFGALPHLGAPTSLSAAEILSRSLKTLTAATGIERLEYELIVTGVAEGGHRIEHLIDHEHPTRYRLMEYGSDGLVHSAIAQDPFSGRRSQLVRMDGQNFIVTVTTSQPLPSVPQMAQAQMEAVIAMMQATADQKLTVVDTAEGRQYVIEIPAVIPNGSAATLDLYQARAVIDERDFRIREFSASGALLKQPYSLSFRLISRDALPPSSVSAEEFAIHAAPGDIVLEGEASDEPLSDVLNTALREIGRLKAGH